VEKIFVIVFLRKRNQFPNKSIETVKKLRKSLEKVFIKLIVYSLKVLNVVQKVINDFAYEWLVFCTTFRLLKL
jgi:hypothetical protein